jgi:hypothetical protein
MGKFDSTIKWLRKQLKTATRTLEELKSGMKIEAAGADVTDEWISRYQRLTERYQRLIAMYEKRDRERT